MAAEIPPDYFPTSPTLSGAGSFPDDMPAPDAGIFDAPAHIAIINQYWVTRLLGMLDGLMYPEAWEAEDAELAYNELLELQAMLMSPANFLIPSDTFRSHLFQSNLNAGTHQGVLKTCPAGKRLKLTSATIMKWSGTVTSLRVQVTANAVHAYLISPTTPAELTAYTWSGEHWLHPGDNVNYLLQNSSLTQGLWITCSGLEYDEV